MAISGRCLGALAALAMVSACAGEGGGRLVSGASDDLMVSASAPSSRCAVRADDSALAAANAQSELLFVARPSLIPSPGCLRSL